MKRNWEGLVLKVLGGRDFRLTVTGRELLNPYYQRIDVAGGGLLDACDLHPTLWIRLWFDDHGRPHQRAYTVVDPDPATGQFSLEFSLHDGCAARWAQRVEIGATIDATLQGSAFVMPEPAPSKLYLVGDPAAVPAVNSLLAAAPATPATIWLEYVHEGERSLPLRTRPHHQVSWIPRRDQGRHLVEAVTAEVPRDPDALYWVACEAASTRAIARHLRRGLGIDKQRVRALGYWRAG
ncbi:siderophore-interacting protein [Natronosporangium hydrolyticum]|uniref:Siderophore-interacting protein n=1 Tax=Natronosporangium hydrolyticum TaxID=2811111 RepID=A0A895Y525_9ACTN|nr:siderophore-interacting protein [Natronosporangium hydrolyticum]QSB12804.1 siderophore-interacting protein [Natronosporangium hydrolyticum]